MSSNQFQQYLDSSDMNAPNALTDAGYVGDSWVTAARFLIEQFQHGGCDEESLKLALQKREQLLNPENQMDRDDLAQWANEGGA
ncbi:hypothetical protein LP421_01810 (plasmid) [Rhizobium sp. RCAM05350]|nr:hypothetical protein LP421_01810 [Rhizobium sp. RCAM05350]